MDKIMVVYDEEYPVYRDTFIASISEIYTSEELGILLEIHDLFPWMYEKFEGSLKHSLEANQANSERVGQKIALVFDSFMEEIEGQKEDEHSGV